jgi:ElaB/YqjD/DUF883 family membrane-anchored ribosome-binding protein
MATTSDMAPARRTPQPKASTETREQQLEAQVAQLQQDIKAITETLGKLTGEKVEDAKQLASAELRLLRRRGQHALDDAQEQAMEVEQQLKDTIREKPFTAVATALGIGFVLALLTRH